MSARKRVSLISPLMRILLALGLLLAATAGQAIERVTYYHNDALGSPAAATDRNGTLLWRENYAPYGERLTHEAGSKDTVWYTGKQEEAAFGLNYFGARWYDPKIGRFMGVDPAGFSADNIQSFNRYAYANNNPYLYVDPDGRWPLDNLKAKYKDRTKTTYDYHTEQHPLAHEEIFKDSAGQATKSGVHKNSLDYVGDTHVYRLKGPDGSSYKIGESAQGTRVSDGASIRAEQQVRQLTRETGEFYQSEIRKSFPNKASARNYETRVIERFRRRYGDDALPGNKTNR